MLKESSAYVSNNAKLSFYVLFKYDLLDKLLWLLSNVS